MKAQFLFLCITIFGISLANGDDLSQGQALFTQGNDAYAAGEFEKAADLYKAASAYGVSDALYFNLGNACFKTDQIGPAILNYERALRLNPSDPDITYNLSLANDRIKDRIEKLPELNITRWWKTFTRDTGTDTWAWLSVGFMVGSVVLFLLFLLSKTIAIRRMGLYASLFFFLITAFNYIQAQRAQHFSEEENEAIVMVPRVDVKGAPSDSGLNVFVIHEGTKVKVLELRDGWMNIRIASGNEGWIPAESGEII